MKKLIIIGARGFGREVLWAVQGTKEYKEGKYTVKGFLDDNKNALNGFSCPYGKQFPPIIGSVEDYIPEQDDVFFCALGEPKSRMHYANLILAKGGEFISIISPLACVSSDARIGKGVFICGWVLISTNVEIGDFTVIHPMTNIGHDVKIGKGCSIESHCFLGGGAQMKDGSMLHPRSNILPHKTIGENTVVGTGSAVMRNFGDNLTLFGNPAKKIF